MSENLDVKTVKRSRSSYQCFCADSRAEVKISNPQLNPKEILTKLGELWQLTKKENGEKYQKYQKMAEEEKAIYEKNKKENPELFVKVKKEKTSVVEKKATRKTKTSVKLAEVSQDGQPKTKKLNGYIKYLNKKRDDFRIENPSLTSKLITKALAEQWQTLTVDEKLAWKES